MSDAGRNSSASRTARAGGLSPRRRGTLRSARTTTTILGRGNEPGRVLPFPSRADRGASVAGTDASGVQPIGRRDIALDQGTGTLGERDDSESLRRFVNVSLAAFFLAPAFIVIGVLWLVHQAIESDRGNFIYRGRRLGKSKRIFTIYKIRTLSKNAERELGANLHVPNGKLESGFGRFLRATRLDELPQLVNIIKGDMNFVGPRPVRPEAYERYRKIIPNYDRNFLVRPGLTGYSQFFTPHSTPKQIRSRIDYRFLSRGSSPFRDVAFILATALTVLRNTAREALYEAVDRIRILRSQWDLVRHTLQVASLSNKRVTRRVARSDIVAFLTDDSFRARLPVDCELIDINHEALCISTPMPLDKNQAVHVVLETHSRRSGRRKRACCKGFVYRINAGLSAAVGTPESALAHTERCYVIFYEPATHLNRYMVDQYVLRNSIG